MDKYEYDMQGLSHILRKTVAKKHLSAPSYMGIILHIIEDTIDMKPETGFLKHSVVYIKLLDQGKKILLFHHKKDILIRIQDTLGEYGYKIQVKDIRFMQ